MIINNTHGIGSGSAMDLNNGGMDAGNVMIAGNYIANSDG